MQGYRWIDLTHTVTKNMPTFPGDPKHQLNQIAFLEDDGFIDFQITSGMHVGTHIDAPAHMIAGGKKISEISLDTDRA